ncbi:MAG: MucB/RseB C-terminal domain-containing protein [Chromatiales bacterium]|jgi:sigma-E factor negative regulatory protein RseB
MKTHSARPQADVIRHSLLLLICTTLLVTPLASPGAEEDPLEILNRMQQTVRQLSYEGDFVYQYGDVLNAMHINHDWQEGNEREYLRTLTGPSREVVRDNFTLAQFDQQKPASVSERRRRNAPTLVTFDPERLSAVYDFRILGKDRVAGRETTIVLVQPRDEMRYGHRLYIDSETALPLRRVVLDRQGKPISQLMFTSISIRKMGDNKQVPPNEIQPGPIDYRGKWSFEGLPEGFVMEIHDSSEQEGVVRSEQFVFSDGIARLSLYIEDRDVANAPGQSVVGPVGILGAEVDGHRVTVVGEAPIETLKHFLKSTRLKESP